MSDTIVVQPRQRQRITVGYGHWCCSIISISTLACCVEDSCVSASTTAGYATNRWSGRTPSLFSLTRCTDLRSTSTRPKPNRASGSNRSESELRDALRNRPTELVYLYRVSKPLIAPCCTTKDLEYLYDITKSRFSLSGACIAAMPQDIIAFALDFLLSTLATLAGSAQAVHRGKKRTATAQRLPRVMVWHG